MPPVAATAPAPAAAPPKSSRPNGTAAKAVAAAATPFGGSAGSEATPSVATAREASAALAAAPGLDSVKRDLDGAFPAGSASAVSSAAAKRQQRANARRKEVEEPSAPQPPAKDGPNYAAILKGARAALPRYDDADEDDDEDDDDDRAFGTPADLSSRPSLTPQKLLIRAALTEAAALPALSMDDGKAPNLLLGLPSLHALRLPTPLVTRMLGRREWLQRLLEGELEREACHARGAISAFEALCGITPHHAAAEGGASSSGRAAAATDGVLRKFHELRSSLLREELREIESLESARGATRA